IVLALAGVVAQRGQIARGLSFSISRGSRDVRAAALTALAVWMLALVPLAWTPNSVTFGYVVAVPMAILAGAAIASGLARLSRHPTTAITAVAILVGLVCAIQLLL